MPIPWAKTNTGSHHCIDVGTLLPEEAESLLLSELRRVCTLSLFDNRAKAHEAAEYLAIPLLLSCDGMKSAGTAVKRANFATPDSTFS